MRLLLIITLLFGILNAQNREALLIGNSNYKHISNLNDISQNLSRLKTTLESLGFSVKVKTNLEAKKLKQAIDNFKDRLAKSQDTIGFLYYSGHGCQMDNVGYLIPTNVNSSKRLDVQYDAINIDKMLETLREAGNRVNMVFLDACRDNTPTGKKGGKKGLAQAPVMPKGTLVVYATEATKTADDNSNFINSLIAQIKQPNRSIRDIGYNISDNVAKETGEQQVPQVFAQRVPNVFLKSGDVVSTTTPKARVIKTQSISMDSSKTLDIEPQTHTSINIVTIDGLMYQNQPFTKTYSWKKAKEYCQDLTLEEYNDWRLPTKKELNTIRTKNSIQGQKYKYYIAKEFIDNLRGYGTFWSLTDDGSSFNAWCVDFYHGKDALAFNTGFGYALCIREPNRQ